MNIPRGFFKTKLPTLAFAVCLTGLGSTACGSPQFGQDSGYHGQYCQPNSGSADNPVGDAQEKELLAESLRDVKGGKLSEAETILSALVRMNPQEPRYSQLLALVKRQIAAESWYRYQRHFGLSWASR
jgi:hypothetical protein